MEAAAAAGMSASAVLAMTPDDVKASDSDQVTIPFDVNGQVKKQVPADRLDWYYRARDATHHIQHHYFQKESIVRVFTAGGGSKDNAHVMVTLDSERGDPEEARGELPEKRKGVRIETETTDGYQTEDHACDDSDYWSDKDNFPGGPRLRHSTHTHTGSCRHYEADLSWFGWTTAAHTIDGCSTGTTIAHSDDGSRYDIGTVTMIDEYRDIAWINENSTVDSSPLCVKPSNHNERVQIRQTLSEEAMETIDAADEPHALYGMGSCYADMNIEGWNGTHTQDDGDCDVNQRVDQMYSSTNIFENQTQLGDSGALYFVEDPDNPGNFYAMGSHSGKGFVNGYSNYGVQGFSIENIYNRRWDS
jgi:hypothetical protein